MHKAEPFFFLVAVCREAELPLEQVEMWNELCSCVCCHCLSYPPWELDVS